MENETLNVNANATPATPIVETVQVAEAVTPPPTSPTTTPFNSAALESLNDEERELFNMSKDLNDYEIGTLPPDMRKEILDLREKLKGGDSAAAEEVKPEDTVQTTGETADTPAVANPEAVPDVDKTDEIIRRLTEENRKLNARYESLKGKYNAEVKNVRKSEPPAAAAPEAEHASADMTDDDIAKFAEAEGVDSDVALALAKIVRKIQGNNQAVANPQGVDASTAERVNELYYARQNELFDAAIRRECGSIGLNDVNSHPLFPSYARELVDENGVTAWDAIIEARNGNDHASAAAIIKQVCDQMDKDDMWNLTSRHTAKSAVAVPVPATVNTPSAGAGLPADKQSTVVKPSAVTPHSASGVSAQGLHTARTLEDVSREYDQLEKQFRRTGDSTLVPRMAQLSKEFGRLAAAQMHRTQ